MSKEISVGVALTDEQRRAAREPERDVLVTAGAGSGKTSTLVARYLWLLANGAQPREIVAITFTEKAAREMRNRVREAVRSQAAELDEPERGRWGSLEARMDAARIGTIHSFCAEVLRTHPAEAGIDPAFEVLEEGAVRALKAEVIDDSLAHAANDPDLAMLFSDLTTGGLRRVLGRLLENRLDLLHQLRADPGLERGAQPAIAAALERFLDDDAVVAALGEMQELVEGGELEQDAGGTLAPQVEQLLRAWRRLTGLRRAGEWLELAQGLYSIRRELLKRGSGKHGSRAKEALADLQAAYDAQLDPWLGGKRSSGEPPDSDLERRLPQLLGRLAQVAELAAVDYSAALAARRAVDFDDLEAGAARLLGEPEIRAHWRETIDHVLVDEFQDTNARQREIVEALAPIGAGRLFVVGDARQSIYRFRGADVTVFRDLASDIEAAGGLVVNLDETFRAHQDLLQALDAAVAPVMGQAESGADYQVPYTALKAVRQEPEAGSAGPHLEFVIAGGGTAGEARPRAARGLAARLLELKRGQQLSNWGQVALLFRASTGFPPYEQALEEAGIPYVTVAGRGFYDRPEIRDLLNALRALADPGDDQALAGFLRSPVIGLQDTSLTALRLGPDGPRPFAEALEEHLNELEPPERAKAERARAVLGELRPIVDRRPVADVLKALVDRLDYRAVLASSQSRLWRNVDKLIQDALTSDLVRVHGFLEYLRTLRTVGAREGEAPSEAEGSVQLMTIHKAKGLEFEVVVLADASRRPVARGEPVYLRPDTGLSLRLDRVDADPLSYQIARARDADETDAEERRLLYVAATRARDRLLINGHLTESKSGWRGDGMLAWLLRAVEIDPDSVSPGEPPASVSLPNGARARMWFAPTELEIEPEAIAAPDWPLGRGAPLVEMPRFEAAEEIDPAIDEEPDRSWRATAVRAYAPAAAVGRMLHAAAARSVQAGSPEVAQLLEAVGLQEGLVDPRQRRKAVQEADELLARLQAQPLWEKIGRADRALSELPYTWQPPRGASESGKIDLLYQIDGQWHLLDFKTDGIRTDEELQEALEEYGKQVQRYQRAARALLGEPVSGSLVFLDDRGHVSVHPVADAAGTMEA